MVSSYEGSGAPGKSVGSSEGVRDMVLLLILGRGCSPVCRWEAAERRSKGRLGRWRGEAWRVLGVGSYLPVSDESRA